MPTTLEASTISGFYPGPRLIRPRQDQKETCSMKGQTPRLYMSVSLYLDRAKSRSRIPGSLALGKKAPSPPQSSQSDLSPAQGACG